jgi:cobalt transporter subunit CbtB
MHDTVFQASPASRVAIPATSTRLQCAMAFVIGAAMVFLVGFSHVEAVHNAAHDTRHSLAFPCH